MKVFIFGILLAILPSLCTAQMKTEKALVNELVLCLQHDDDSAYVALQPTYDTLWLLATSFVDTAEWKMRRLSNLLDHPEKLQQFDPYLNKTIVPLFDILREKAIDSGIHWNDVLIARYELKKQSIGFDMVGLDLIIPERLHGYIFLQDVLNRKMYCVVVRDIFKIFGQWYGGQVINILQAATVAEYNMKRSKEEVEMQALYAAIENGTLDSLVAARKKEQRKKSNIIVQTNEPVADNPLSMGNEDFWEDEKKEETIFKEIVDRRVYEGYLDQVIPVTLYIRALKGPCPDPECEWEAIYKFGDVADYVPLEVVKKPDGTWEFYEGTQGLLELKEQHGGMVGRWISFKDHTEYQAIFEKKDAVKSRKLYKLDKTIEDRLLR